MTKRDQQNASYVAELIEEGSVDFPELYRMAHLAAEAEAHQVDELTDTVKELYAQIHQLTQELDYAKSDCRLLDYELHRINHRFAISPERLARIKSYYPKNQGAQ